MAFMVKKSLIPRYCPGIQFPGKSGKFMLKYSANHILHRIDPEEVPKHAFLESTHKTIADFVSIRGRLSMCAEARNIIEALEPGRHQFFPVEITRKRSKKPIYRLDGRVLDEPYYMFNIQTWLDAVIIEQSKVVVTHTSANIPPLVYPVHNDYDIKLNKSIVDGHHVWRGHRQCPLNLFFSDLLIDKLLEKKLRKLEFFKLVEF
jgi:hypothetical protein